MSAHMHYVWRAPWPTTHLCRQITLPSGRTVAVHGELVSLVFTNVYLEADPTAPIFDARRLSIQTHDDVWIFLLFCMYSSMNLTSLGEFETMTGDTELRAEYYVDALMLASVYAPALIASGHSPLFRHFELCIENRNAECTRMIQRIVEHFEPSSDARAGRMLCYIVRRLLHLPKDLWSFVRADTPRIKEILAGVFLWLCALPVKVTGDYIDTELAWIRTHLKSNDPQCQSLWSAMPVSAVRASGLVQEWAEECGISQRVWLPSHQNHVVLASQLTLVTWLPSSIHLYTHPTEQMRITAPFVLRMQIEMDTEKRWDRFILPHVGLCEDDIFNLLH